MPKLLLTDPTIRALKLPSSGQVTYWDNKLPGFGCRVSQGGQRTFVVMYGPREARRRKVVGRYPVQSLKDARDEAKKVMAGLTLGIIEAKTVSLSYLEAVERYLAEVKQRTRPRTLRDYTRLLSRFFPFGKRQLSDITKQDIERCLAKLHSVPSELLHARTIIRIFFNWAYRAELIEQNPADRLQKPIRVHSRERVLNETELQTVLKSALKFTWPFGPIVSLCILTGQRRSEIGMLEWKWIDFKQNLITLPGPKVKNGQTHVFPFGSFAAEILSELPQIDQYLFSGRTNKNATFNGWARSKCDFDKTLDEVAHYTLHDLRRTFSTAHAKIGTPIQVTEKLLNHVSGTVSGVAAIYNRHSYMPEMREAITNYESYLSNLVSQ